MLPVEHFIVALLPALAYGLLRDRSIPSTRLFAVLFLGSQFPDLVDKPLAHQFGLIPSGRVFMHSLPIAIPFLAAIGYYGWKTGRPRLSGGFVFASLSHLLADNYELLLEPAPTVSPDLLWPFVEPVPRTPIPYWAGVNGINVRLWTVFSIVVLSISCYLLIVDVREHY